MLIVGEDETARVVMARFLRYMRGQDRLDPALHRSAFHDNAWVNGGLMKGTADEFVAFAQNLPGDMQGSQHIIARTDIAADGFLLENPGLLRGARRGADFSETRDRPV